MPVIVADTPKALHRHRSLQGTVALVPTMGNLHEGHLQLVELACKHADHVIVSVFVNRLQFAPHEDFDRYPRTLAADCHALESLGENITVFAPQESVLYPRPQTFRITPDPMADTLEGFFRPGFFGGVCTVVMKLFHLVNPQIAVFGKKDRQQITLIRNMIEQFALPIELIAGETIRNPDGLALSSRNAYLSPSERTQATELYQALHHAANEARSGNANYAELENHAIATLEQQGWSVDYIAIRDTATLNAHPTPPGTAAVILGAARLGKTRLIDNLDI